MTEREQLREEIATALFDEYDDGDEPYVFSSYHLADAVLAVLDQQGWVSPTEHNRQLAGAELTHQRLRDQRDAALREAARYEPIPDTMHRVDCPWTIWNFGPDVFSSDVPDDGPDCDCESDIYRRVTEGGEG